MSEAKNIFEWDQQKFTTYVEPMDIEHQGLINIMNQLYQLNEKGAPKSQLQALIDQLGKKTKEHFDHEEKYLESLPKYTSLPSHKIIHKNLLDNYQKHSTSFKESKDAKVPTDFFLFLKVWLSAHICGIDRKYGEIAKAG